MTWYNQTRQVEDLLAKNVSLPPSFTVHLHTEHWTLNNGSKFLYTNHVASLLDDIRNHQIPVDYLDTFEAARVPFYEGCMIVELVDYRPRKPLDPPLDVPERTRTVLHPTAESMWSDICSLNVKHGGKWTDMDALEVESKILLATVPPLCLDPDPHLARMVNHIVKVSAPTVPRPLKRKASTVVQEEDETGKARRAKIMQFMASRSSRPSNNFRLIDTIQSARDIVKANNPASQSIASASNHPSPAASLGARAPTPYKSTPTPAPDKVQQQQKEAQMTQTFASTSHNPVQQTFHPQNLGVTKASTPSPRTQTPHQSHQVPAFSVHAQDPNNRIPTPSQQQQQPIQAQVQPVSRTQAGGQLPAPATAAQAAVFQPPLVGAPFTLQQPTTRNNQNKMAKAQGQIPAHMYPPAALAHLTPQQQQQFMQQHIRNQQLAQRAQAGPQVPHQPQQNPQQPIQQQPTVQQQQAMYHAANGRYAPTPAPGGEEQKLAAAALASKVAPNAQMHMSPHITNQRIASRSPMPHTQPAATPAVTPQLTPHQTPHTQHATTPHRQQPAQLQQHSQNPQMQAVVYPYANPAQGAQYANARGASATPRPPQAGVAVQQPHAVQNRPGQQMYYAGYPTHPQMYQMPGQMGQQAMYWRLPNGSVQALQQQQQQQAAAAGMKQAPGGQAR